MSCIDVMLVDDHVLIREGIKQLLEFDKSIKVVDEASDGDECLSKLTKTSAQVLLLDINMPKKNGLDVLEEIKAKKLNIKVLILTVHDEIEYLLKAVDIGVDGYILKDSEIKELKTAIQVLACGESYIQPKLIPALNSRLIDRDSDKEKLTLLKNKGFLEMKRCFDNSPGGMLYFLSKGLIYKIDCIYTRYPNQWETGNSTYIVVVFLNGPLQGKKAYLDLYAFPQSKPLKPQGESFSIKVESKLLR